MLREIGPPVRALANFTEVYVETPDGFCAQRRVRAIETPEGTGFRDLLGHWVFEDESGKRIDGNLLSGMARRNLPELTKIAADLSRAKKTQGGREWLAAYAVKLATDIEPAAQALRGVRDGDDGLAIAKVAREIARDLCPEIYGEPSGQDALRKGL